MKTQERECRKPSILIPYSGCSGDCAFQDFFLYLRPESNGFLVESVLLGVIQKDPLFKAHCKLVYLANLPGDFIRKSRIIEKHYDLKLYFVKQGKSVFTPTMKEVFEKHFGESFENAEILGAYDALIRLKMNEEELFNMWVEEKDILYIHGQCIKRKGDIYIINYDIPALLHKNTVETDIAVMIFRIATKVLDFSVLLKSLEGALRNQGILGPKKPASRIFHYSKGPFEQILDGMGYLYNPQGDHISLKQLSFCSFLLNKGITMNSILRAIKNPIAHFKNPDGSLQEDNLLTRTYNVSYEEAYRIFTTLCNN